MAGRGMRVRAPVSYSDKDSMVPAWLKTIQPSVTDAPQDLKTKKKKKVQTGKKAIEGSSDKENSTSHGGEPGAVRPKGQSSAVGEKKGTNAAKTMKKKSTISNEKSSKAAATRGRNAGLTVVPIGDGPQRGAKVGKQVAKATEPKKAVKAKKAAKGASAVQDRNAKGSIDNDDNGPTKPVPGLPWARQQVKASAQSTILDASDGERTPTPLLAKPGLKRKNSPNQYSANEFLDEMRGGQEKKKLQGIADKFVNVSSSQRNGTNQNLADPFGDFSPVRVFKEKSPSIFDNRRRDITVDLSDLEKRYGLESPPRAHKPLELPELNGKHIQEMRESMAQLVELCTKLEEENTALKDLKIREDIEQVIEMQNEKVREHGKAASDVAEHWKAEAERLAEMLDKGHVDEITQKLRAAESKISELELEVNDLKVSGLGKDSRISELQKRNTFLEKYARIYATADKCVGTDQPNGVDMGVQAPHGILRMQAKSMAPEGAPGSSMYTYGGVDADGPRWGVPRGHLEKTFAMQPQVTVPNASSVSRRVSGASVGPYHANLVNHAALPGTKESHTVPNNRRMSAPPAPLVGPDGQPRQIEFYSGSGHAGTNDTKAGSARLETVREEAGMETDKQGAAIPEGERHLLGEFGLEAELSHEGVVYSHPRTGFMFKIIPAEEDDEDDESGPAFDLEYIPLAWGVAREAVGNCEILQDQLLERMSFMSQSREFLLKQIGDALRKA